MNPTAIKKRREAIEAELARLTEKNGGALTPTAVVEAARRPSSPMHELFDWNDSTAANKWRLEQARTLIRSVEVRVTVDERVIKLPHYVRDPRCKHKEGGYAPVTAIASQEDLKRRAMQEEYQRLMSVLERVESLAKYLGEPHGLDRVRKSVKRHWPAAGIPARATA